MRSRFMIVSLLAACALGGASAAEKKTVTYFEEVCGACHGEKGQGTPNLAPPLKGNKFVIESSAADIGSVITKGREGAAKHYKDLPSPMPAQSLSADKLAAVISYIKNELQQ